MNTKNDIQDELFHEDFRDSLRHLVKALGGMEAVGADLWPSKTRHAAGSWLSDCLNAERPAKLDLEDLQALLRMGRKAGCHTAMFFLADACDYQRPALAVPKSPESQALERIARLAHEQAQAQRELDRIRNEQVRAIR